MYPLMVVVVVVAVAFVGAVVLDTFKARRVLNVGPTKPVAGDHAQMYGRLSNEAYMALIKQMGEYLSPEPDWSAVYISDDFVYWFNGRCFYGKSLDSNPYRMNITKDQAAWWIKEGKWVRSDDHVLIEQYGDAVPARKFKPSPA